MDVTGLYVSFGRAGTNKPSTTVVIHRPAGSARVAVCMFCPAQEQFKQDVPQTKEANRVQGLLSTHQQRNHGLFTTRYVV